MVDGLHQKAIEYYRMYLIIGGMPAPINAFLKNKKLLDVDSVKIRACYNSIPAQLQFRCVHSKISNISLYE